MTRRATSSHGNAHGHWLLIDGHNLIHASPSLRALMSEPERARKQLEALLSAFPSKGHARIAVFYDGGPGGEPAQRHRDGIVAQYSGSGEADDQLVGWLRARSGIRALVVTDDRALRARVRALGASTTGCTEFLAKLPQPRTHADDAPALDAAEVDAWMRVFGIDFHMGDYGPP